MDARVHCFVVKAKQGIRAHAYGGLRENHAVCRPHYRHPSRQQVKSHIDSRRPGGHATSDWQKEDRGFSHTFFCMPRCFSREH